MRFRLPRYVLFDLDGTLLDSLPGITFSVREACRAVGLEDRELDLRPFIGPPIRAIFARALETDDGELLDRLELAFRSSYDSDGWQKTPCFDGAVALLERLKAAGHRMFVVSNKPRHIALRILAREGVLNCMDQVYTRDSRTPHYASKAEMIRTLIEEHDLSPAHCIMVGDTIEDVTAAAENQVQVVFMEHGYGDAPSSGAIALRLQSFHEFQAMLSTGAPE